MLSAFGWLLFSVLLPGLAGLAAALPAGAADNVALMSLADSIDLDMVNYSETDGPFYSGEFAADLPTTVPRELIVVSYNLRYGEAIDEMVRVYERDAPLPAADIILLQEMDAAGVAAVAERLGYNYVYYPASVAGDGDDFGNAILARWPISDPAKLLLPGEHPLTGQRRTATRAVVDVGGSEILVYSTHIEVSTAPQTLRAAQARAILDDIPAAAERVIVGGDFNTVTARGVRVLAAAFSDAGLAHDSAGLGPTFTRFGLRPSATDHLFSRGLERLDAGVLSEITASDHFPVWSRLALP